jgi:hypothetical protein
MKGVIILPKYLSKFWIPKSSDYGDDFSAISSATAPLYYAMRDSFGFELRYADEVDVDSDTDIVFMFGVPYHNRINLLPGLIDLDKKIKLIMYTGDVQCYGNKKCLENKIKVYDRCDIILSQSYEYFAKIYPQFLFKYEFLPLFFSPHDRYMKFSFNDDPKMRCLLSGAVNSKIYPLRSFVKKQSNNIDCKRAIGDKYAELLNSYFCCVTSCSIFNYVLAKHLEIPSTGSLLLTNETSDLKRAGFISNYHYVPVTKKNVIAKISYCLKKPNKYKHIRKQGMEFVRKNHSVVNRIEQLKRIFDGLMV